MSTIKPKTTITTLHEELVIQILSSLAVKDIIRCKCVCKSWCSLIMSPSFIDEQLKVSNGKHPDLLIKYIHISYGFDFPKCKYPKVDLVSHETLEVVDTQIVLSNTIGIDMMLATKNTIVGCCNGVVCFYHDASNVILWNPATRDAKLLPPPLYRCHPEKSATFEFVAIGCGFDAKNDDYKVISVQKLRKDWNRPKKMKEWPRRFEVEIYSLKKNCWRLLPDDPNLKADMDIAERCRLGMSTKGTVSWLSSRKGGFNKSYEVVVSFDISNEVFIKPSCPRSLFNRQLRSSLVAPNGSVALTRKSDEVLRRYGEEESWPRSKVLQVFPFNETLVPIRKR